SAIAGCRRQRRNADFEVLVALSQGIEVKSVGGIGKENLRPDFRVDRLGVHVREGDAENERAQVIDIGDAAKIPEGTLGHETRVLAALVLRWSTDAAIYHSLIIEVHEGVVAGPSTKFTALKPAPFRKVLRAQRGVHAAIEDPVHGFAGNLALCGRVAETRNQQSSLPMLFLYRMRHKRKIEHRYAHQPEVAVVNFGAAVHIHRNAPGVKAPLRTRQFAGGDRALAHQIVIGPVFFDNFSGKGKRIGGGKYV